MVTKRTDYTSEAVEAARRVMLELSRVLGEYQNDMVIVGGWVPELLIENAQRAHIGSLDVDVALNHRTLHEVGFKTILQLLLSHGYRQSEQPFIFFRTVVIDERQIDVEVDFWPANIPGQGADTEPSVFKTCARAKHAAANWRSRWQPRYTSAARYQDVPGIQPHFVWPPLCHFW